MSDGYEIRVEGLFDETWSAWFDNLQIVGEAGDTTVIVGSVADQAALFGILRRISDLGLTLLDVHRL